MTDREKLIELVKQGIDAYCNSSSYTELQKVVADHLIANGVTIQRWIPVTERLPDKNMKCLCSYVFHENTDYHFEQVLFYYATCENPHFQHEGELGLKVTHWMPLPDLPKGE